MFAFPTSRLTCEKLKELRAWGLKFAQTLRLFSDCLKMNANGKRDWFKNKNENENFIY